MSKLSRILLLLFLTALLSACFRSYKYDVQQGNIVDQERLSKVERGMSKRDVQTLLGTPLVHDKFHPNRWDYAYYLKEGRSKETISRLITLYFEDEKLARITGDVTTSDAASIDSGIKVIKIEDKPDSGFFSNTLDDLFKKNEKKAP